MNKYTVRLDAHNIGSVVEVKDVCGFCHAVLTLSYRKGGRRTVALRSVLFGSVNVTGVGDYDVSVVAEDDKDHILNVYIEPENARSMPYRGGLVLSLGTNDCRWQAVFCSWACAQAGVQGWVQSVAAEMVKKALAS